MSMAEEKGLPDAEKKETADPAPSKNPKPKGLISRIWNGIFRFHGDDFEKRLQHISKEEAAVLARMKRRSQTWRKMTRHFILLALILEVIAVGYAIMTTRSVDLDWKMRVYRLLPMCLLPAFFSAAYSAYVRITRMCDCKDQKTLERLRAERQAKIDELKEKTNYYMTQQLIQRYDPDPAAKAAAATVLASKLGAESGLKVYVGDESKLNAPTGKSNDVKVVESSGLRNRKPLHARSSSVGRSPLHHLDDETPPSAGDGVLRSSEHNQLLVGNHQYPQGSSTHGGGWLSRLAALLVGEDPTQSYALICGNCHMHNGLARKEDFPYVTYYCLHCHALNRPKQLEEHTFASGSPNSSSIKGAENGAELNITNTSVTDTVITGRTPAKVGPEIEEVSEKVASRYLAS